MIIKDYILKNKILSILFVILFVILFIFYFFTNNKYFILDENDNPFFIIPENKEGITIINQDKKSLHLSYENSSNIEISNELNIQYSIQLITNSDYSYIKEKMNELINLKDSIFDSKDLYISAFISNSSTEYFLLYKNFESRNIAQDFCEKYTYFVDKCLIVNVKNLQ
tara:strand:- start:173 stop:676 length:504 start_codon:yes stop_codon:yes gene_type:complete